MRFALISVGALVSVLVLLLVLVACTIMSDAIRLTECNAKGGYFQYRQCTDGPYGQVIVVR